VTDNPRLNEATEEQLRAQLEQLDQRTDYDRMMDRLLEHNRQQRDAEWADVKQLKVDMQELFDRSREAVAMTRPCTICDAEVDQACVDNDTHVVRTMGIKDEDVEDMARKLQPDLFVEVERYQKMINEGKRG